MGKSTLLRLSAGLEKITGGYLQCGAQRIGYVFQDATLLPWRSVLDNVALLGELDGVRRPSDANEPRRRSERRPYRVREPSAAPAFGWHADACVAGAGADAGTRTVPVR